MTNRQKLEVRASEIRERLNELSNKEDPKDEERQEIDRLTAEYSNVEARRRAAIVAEGAGEGAGEGAEGAEAGAAEGAESTDDSEARELNELIDKVELRRYMHAAAQDQDPRGAEAELVDALNLRNVQAGVVVPWVALDTGVEERQDARTDAPATVDRTMEAILGRVFARTSAAWCGVRMPGVGVGERDYPVLTAGTTAETKAKGAAQDASAATFTVTSIGPRRLTARYLFAIEDLAVFSGMEEALRADLGGTMGEELDKAILVGDGTSPNVAGFFDDDALAAPAAAASEATNATYVNAITDRVDGRYAVDASTVRMLVGSKTYGHMASKWLASTDTSALAQVRGMSGGVRVSAHVPAVTSKKQNALLIRGGGSAVAPMWPALSMIRDPYSGAAKGEISLTVVALYGFKIVRDAGFARVEFQVEA